MAIEQVVFFSYTSHFGCLQANPVAKVVNFRILLAGEHFYVRARSAFTQRLTKPHHQHFHILPSNHIPAKIAPTPNTILNTAYITASSTCPF